MAEQNAQENTLLSVLEHLKSGNEETKSSAKETKEVAKEVRKQRSDVGKHHNWNKKHGAEQSKVGKWMVGYFGWAKKTAERAAKAAKIGAQSAVDFGKEKLKSVQQFAGNMLDLLLKGLGLAALWALFKFLSENSWEETIAKVKGWLGDIGIEWDNAVAVLDGIWIVLTRISGSFWVFKGVVNLIKGWFGWGGPLGGIMKFMWGLGFNAMFIAGSAIMRVLGWIGGKFGSGGFLGTALKAIKDSAFFTKWFGEGSKIREVLNWIKSIFGGEGKVGTFLKSMKGAVVGKFAAWFGESSKIREIFRWIGTFFGSADEGGKIAKAIQSITQNKLIQGIGKFLGSIGGKMLKFFGPIGWLMAGYDAVMAFWETFQSTEGSLWDKTVAGLSAGIQAIVDFFVFDMIGLAEKGVKWLIKKVMGLFGMDEKKVESSEWFKFSITGFLKEAFGDYMKILEGIFRLKPELALEGLKGLFGKAADILGWLFDIAIKPAINWIGKNIFGMKEDAISADFSLSKWLKEKVLNPIIDGLSKLFSMDFAALAKSIMPEWLYNLFAGSAAEETKKKLMEQGLYKENTLTKDDIDLNKLQTLLESKKGDNQKALAGELSALLEDDDLAEADREKLKTLLSGYGAKLNKGGFGPAGKTVPAVLHGPEIIKPLPDLASAGALGGGATTVAPTTIINKSSGSTTMMMGSSSIDKSSWKYGMQGA